MRSCVNSKAMQMKQKKVQRKMEKCNGTNGDKNGTRKENRNSIHLVYKTLVSIGNDNGTL